jgi:hypothetical protein
MLTMEGLANREIFIKKEIGSMEFLERNNFTKGDT